MDQGKLPHLDALRRVGGYRPLGTSIPPQSPVAWASFITGADPGVHGIFDFIHRNPAKQYHPRYSAAETVKSEEGWEVGEHRLPLTFWPFNHKAPQTLLRREGTPFWDYLDAAGVPMWIYEIPANYPPSPSKHGHLCCLSGMGTPDLLGTYGTYQHFSEATHVAREEGGGMRKPLLFNGNEATLTLVGPENPYLQRPSKTQVNLRIFRHPTRHSARIDLQDRSIILKEGEWSEWCKISFEIEMPPFLPNHDVNGICRFYLQQVYPDFLLYVSPINIDPSDPGDQRITEPADFITDVSEELGLFYTTGFQEDHKALSNEVFTDEEFHRQAEYVLAERMNLLKYAIDHFEDGLLFFYFSSTDLQAHMFWWDSDDKHPVRSIADARKYHRIIEDLYVRMDAVVGDLEERFGDEATMLVMSDHGFCNFRRQFNLNTWLRDNGYVQPALCKSLVYDRDHPVDWSRTRAYGLGLNGLYLNLKGRERDGILEPWQREALLEELSERLLAVRDPLDGQPVVARVYRSDEVYSGPQSARAPDLIIGYHRGYRASWATTLGKITDEVMSDNDSAWSADHCIAADQVPGVIFSNRHIRRPGPSLVDLAPTILEEFGLTAPETMKGGSLFKSTASATTTSERSVVTD
jgi:predicted AlkP superfamily phosphohydrolase/phosphomutase